MTTVNLPRNIFAPVVECGSAIIQKSDGNMYIVTGKEIKQGTIIDCNLCFYTCIMQHLADKMTPDFWRKLSLNKNDISKHHLILINFKKYLTSSLPFANIFIGNEDPSNNSISCDHRVIQKAATVFKMTIYILDNGNKIYCFDPEYTESTSEVFLFFHRSHYRIILEAPYQNNIRILYKTPEKIGDLYKPHSGVKQHTYKTVLLK